MLPLKAVETIPPPLFQLLMAPVVPAEATGLQTPSVSVHSVSLPLSSEAACQGTSVPGRLMVKGPLE